MGAPLRRSDRERGDLFNVPPSVRHSFAKKLTSDSSGLRRKLIMQKSQFRGRVINYISERYCKEAGGFCFYRLEEPNGSDTYYALATLKLLDSLYGDDKTVRYLKRTQCEDGTFTRFFAAFYVIKKLQLLGESLDYDPVLVSSWTMSGFTRLKTSPPRSPRFFSPFVSFWTYV